EVIWNGSPTLVPASDSKRRAHRVNMPLRSDRKYSTRPSRDQWGLSSYQRPSVTGRQLPPAPGVTWIRETRASARSAPAKEIQRWLGEKRDSKMFLAGSEAITRSAEADTTPSKTGRTQAPTRGGVPVRQLPSSHAPSADQSLGTRSTWPGRVSSRSLPLMG